MQRGFTLIQISILLVVASLVLVAVLPSTRTKLNANNATEMKMNAILTAMRTYEATHAYLPCPADASQPTAGANYGLAAANSGTGSPGNCTGGTPAANYVDTTNNVAVGMVPVRTLGLSNDYAIDAYGRDITYAVDTNATTCFIGSLPGKITVTDNGSPNTTVAALISHGADGHGAWIPLTGTTGTAVRLNAGSTDTNTLLNAHVNSSFTPTTPLTNFVRSPPAPTFDDLLVYKSNLWTLNTAPASTSVLLPTVALTSPTGSYFTGQTVGFSVTYSSAPTVSGTPELQLSVPQQSGSNATHYATYTGTSGSTMNFTYTVQSGDYVPTTATNATMASPILLNGGSVTVGGVAACRAFSPPNLNGVLLNPVSIYVADTGNSRVEVFSGTGSYVNQWNGSTSGTGTFMNPYDVLVDGSGNVWVTDVRGGDDDRVQEYTGAGGYLSQFTVDGINGQTFNTWPVSIALSPITGYFWISGYGSTYAIDAFTTTGTFKSPQLGCSTGTCSASAAAGAFNDPAGVAVDKSGNIWVADLLNDRIEEFSGSGTLLRQVGVGTLGQVIDVAVDGGGNIWATSNSLLYEFTPTGTLLGSWGNGYGTGPGQFQQIAFLAIDPTGNIWVTDQYNQNVQEFSSCGVYLGQFGSSNGNPGSGNGQLHDPNGISIYPNTPGGGGACVATLTPPTNGAYTTGQALTFTVTYNTPVTVTGSPQLVVTIGSNTRYATYSAGSGSNTLTFTYTIQSSDSATGISVGTSISLNGGTITTTSNATAASLAYTAPAMGGITINSTSFMLVADNANDRVQKLDLLGNFLGQYGCTGNSGCPDGGTANGQLYKPYDVTVDGSGNVWVMDSYNYRVEEFSSSGTYMSQIGCVSGGCNGNGFGSGPGQFDDSATGIPPTGITIDGNGNIWAIDSGDTRVEKFNSSSTYQTQLGTTNTTGCTPSLFQDAQYVHYDPSNNIYVADAYCGTIQEFTNAGSYVKTFGPKIPGYRTFSQDVDDFAFDSCGNIWVQDEGNGLNLVELDYAGNYITSGSLGSYVGGEQSIAIDASGNLYILDEDDNSVLVLNPTSGFVRQFGSTGSGPVQFNGAEGLILVGTGVTRLAHSACPAVILSTAGPSNGTYTTSSALGFAVTYDQAVTVTGTPQIDVAIGANTRAANYISGSGTTTLTFQYTIVAGDNANTGITMDVPIALNGGTITSNSINADLGFQPPTLTQVLVNPVSYSNFYIADSANHVVRKVTASTGYISTVAGTGVSGTVTAGTATSSKLKTPTGVALDSTGNLYIADSGDHEVLKVNTSGVLSVFAGTGTSGTITAGAATSSKLNAPTGVAVDSGANVYIADGSNSEVLKVNSSGTLSIFAGTGTSGTVTAGTATSSKLNTPVGVATDNFGNVFITDTGNHEVLKVASGTLSVFAGTGTSGSTNDNNNSAATAAKLKTPYGVTADTSDNVYIADSGNDVILKVAASNGKISIITGTVGTASYTGDGNVATLATESAAKGVGVDTGGNVYIADTGNNLVRWIMSAFSTINPIAGNGTAGNSGNGAAATSGEISAPTGVAVSR